MLKMQGTNLNKIDSKNVYGEKHFFLVYSYLSMLSSQIKYLNRKRNQVSLVLLVPQEPRLVSRNQFPVRSIHEQSVGKSLLECFQQ